MSPVRERDTAALSLFADEMKAAREQRAWSQADLADQIPYSLSTISMVEALHRVPTRDLAGHLDKAFDTPGTFTRLEGRLRDLPFPASFRPFAAYETEATALYVFEHTFIPGLLQTEDYARAVLSRHLVTSDDQVAERVKARLARQAVLDRAEPPLLWSVIDESALRRMAGTAEVMRGQLAHLAEMARRPPITVQVLAAGVHIGLQGAFNVAEIAGSGSPGTAYLEDAADGRIIEDAATVGRLSVRFRHLQIEALTPVASVEIIEQIARER